MVPDNLFALVNGHIWFCVKYSKISKLAFLCYENLLTRFIILLEINVIATTESKNKHVYLDNNLC